MQMTEILTLLWRDQAGALRMEHATIALMIAMGLGMTLGKWVFGLPID